MRNEQRGVEGQGMFVDAGSLFSKRSAEYRLLHERLWDAARCKIGGRMRCAYSFVVALFGLMLAARPAIAQTMPMEFPLQKAETSVDDHGCLNFVAATVVDAQVEDLMIGLWHPEELYGG